MGIPDAHCGSKRNARDGAGGRNELSVSENRQAQPCTMRAADVQDAFRTKHDSQLSITVNEKDDAIA